MTSDRKYKIIFSPDAIVDLKGIERYIWRITEWEISVKNHRNAILDKISGLDTFPIRNSHIIRKNGHKYYRATEKKYGYVILYRIVNERWEIRIERIIGGGRDLERVI